MQQFSLLWRRDMQLWLLDRHQEIFPLLDAEATKAH